MDKQIPNDTNNEWCAHTRKTMCGSVLDKRTINRRRKCTSVFGKWLNATEIRQVAVRCFRWYRRVSMYHFFLFFCFFLLLNERPLFISFFLFHHFFFHFFRLSPAGLFDLRSTLSLPHSLALASFFLALSLSFARARVDQISSGGISVCVRERALVLAYVRNTCGSNMCTIILMTESAHIGADVQLNEMLGCY